MKNQRQHRLESLHTGTVRADTPVTPLITRARKLGRLVLPALLVAMGLVTTPAFAAPAPPSAPNMAATSDSGSSSTDNTTNVTQPTFAGTGIAFSSLTLYAGTTAVGFAIVPPSGQWTIAPNSKLSDGTYAMTVRQTSGGTQSAPSGSLKIVIDTVKPASPSRPDMVATSDFGTSNTDNFTNTTTPTFSGTASSGDAISLYNTTVSNAFSIGATKTSAQGTWTAAVTSALPSGVHSCLIAARATDVAGNVSSFSIALAISVDTVKPAVASAPDLFASDDSGASNTDNITNVTTPSFTVKTEPYGKVVLHGVNGNAAILGSAVADGNGIATVKSSPLNNNYTLYIINFDKSGNQASALSPTLSLSVDTAAPAVPGQPLLDPNSDTGVIQDHITKIKTPVFHGTSADDGVLTISYFAGIFYYYAQAPVKFQAWAVAAPALPDGVYDVTATNTDIAGNSSTSPAYQLTIDTVAPLAPSAPDLSHFTDTGVSDTDNKTNAGNLEFEGTCQGVLKIILYSNGVAVATKDSGFNQWLVKVAPGKSGPFQVSAATQDVAGNISTPSATLTVLVDLSAPSSTLTAPSASVVQDLNPLAGTALDSTVNGDSSGIDKVTVGIRRLSGNGGFWSGSAWGNNNIELPTKLVGNQWNKTSGLPIVGDDPLAEIQDGDYQIIMNTYDKAGNLTESHVVVTVDNTAPTLQIVTPIPNSILQTFTDLHGTATDKTGVTQVIVKLSRKRNNVIYYWNGSAFTTVVATINATLSSVGGKNINWNCNTQLPTSADLDSGLYTVSATAFDTVGNSQVSTQSFTLQGSRADYSPSGSGGKS